MRICRTWAEACAAADVPLRDGAGDIPTFLRQNPTVHAFERGELDAGAFSQRISEEIGAIYSPKEIHQVVDAWVLEEYEGMRDLVQSLNALPEIETACLSNTNALHWEDLRRMPPIRELAHQHASHLFGLRKPDEACYRAFEEAVRRAGREILFFDDTPENLDTARRLDWRAERIDHEGSPAQQIRAALEKHSVNLGA